MRHQVWFTAQNAAPSILIAQQHVLTVVHPFPLLKTGLTIDMKDEDPMITSMATAIEETALDC